MKKINFKGFIDLCDKSTIPVTIIGDQYNVAIEEVDNSMSVPNIFKSLQDYEVDVTIKILGKNKKKPAHE